MTGRPGSRRVLRGVLCAGAALAVGMVTQGCAGVSQSESLPAATSTPALLDGSRVEPSLPPGMVLPSGEPDTTPFASISGGRLYVTIWGSSSCRALPVALKVENQHEVDLGLWQSGGVTCTADLAANTVSLPLDPATVDLTAPVTVHLSGLSSPLPDATARPVG